MWADYPYKGFTYTMVYFSADGIRKGYKLYLHSTVLCLAAVMNIRGKVPTAELDTRLKKELPNLTKNTAALPSIKW